MLVNDQASNSKLSLWQVCIDWCLTISCYESYCRYCRRDAIFEYFSFTNLAPLNKTQYYKIGGNCFSNVTNRIGNHWFLHNLFKVYDIWILDPNILMVKFSLSYINCWNAVRFPQIPLHVDGKDIRKKLVKFWHSTCRFSYRYALLNRYKGAVPSVRS